MSGTTPSRDQVRFAHPAESTVARLLDAYGVRWLYEPTTFPLITSESGLPLQCFTPDFFLPDHQVYIEMTTMRQALVTRKNRKFRLMRELYPHLDVRLLYRKDVELIIDRYRIEGGTPEVAPGVLFATAEQIHRKANEIAAHLEEYGDQPLALIALERGAERFRDEIAAAAEARGIQVVKSDAAISRATGLGGESGPTLRIDSTADLRGCRRILVADIVSTGLTAHAAQACFAAAAMPVAGIVALLERRTARLIGDPLLVPGLNTPSTWIVGAGLGGNRFADVHDLRATESVPHPSLAARS